MLALITYYLPILALSLIIGLATGRWIFHRPSKPSAVSGDSGSS